MINDYKTGLPTENAETVKNIKTYISSLGNDENIPSPADILKQISTIEKNKQTLIYKDLYKDNKDQDVSNTTSLNNN